MRIIDVVYKAGFAPGFKRVEDLNCLDRKINRKVFGNHVGIFGLYIGLKIKKNLTWKDKLLNKFVK